jgi:nicotinamide riboside transporter PnuC
MKIKWINLFLSLIFLVLFIFLCFGNKLYTCGLEPKLISLIYFLLGGLSASWCWMAFEE